MEKFESVGDVAEALATAVTHSAQLESDPVVIRFRKIEEAAARHRFTLDVNDVFDVWGAKGDHLYTADTVEDLANWFNENYGEEV